MDDEELQERFREWVQREGEGLGRAQRQVWQELFKVWRSREEARKILGELLDDALEQELDSGAVKRAVAYLHPDE